MLSCHDEVYICSSDTAIGAGRGGVSRHELSPEISDHWKSASHTPKGRRWCMLHCTHVVRIYIIRNFETPSNIQHNLTTPEEDFSREK